MTLALFDVEHQMVEKGELSEFEGLKLLGTGFVFVWKYRSCTRANGLKILKLTLL
jgi:hypothetical protein